MIKSIEIEGYRILDNFSADFNDLTVVIGANATGKSTLIDCLQFISRCAQYPLKDVVAWGGGMDSILTATRKTDKLSFKMTFRKPTHGAFWDVVPLRNDCYVYELFLEKDLHLQPIPTYELLRSEKPNVGHKDPMKFLETTRHRSQIFSPTKNRLIPSVLSRMVPFKSQSLALSCNSVRNWGNCVGAKVINL